MILVIGYKDGKDCRHEVCYDLISADQKAEEFRESRFYDSVEIVVTGENDGPEKV